MTHTSETIVSISLKLIAIDKHRSKMRAIYRRTLAINKVITTMINFEPNSLNAYMNKVWFLGGNVI